MENPNSKMIILNSEKLETRFALLNGGRLDEYEIERFDDTPKVGSIYLGKIVNLEASLQAAFIDIGAEKNAFLHYHDMIPGGEDLLDHRAENGGDDEDDENARSAKNRPSGESLTAKRSKRNSSARAAEIQNQTQLRRKKLTVATIPEFFRPGMEILVQVVKSPLGTKGARVTTDVSIPGRFLVLMPYADHIGLSSKIDSEQERSRLRKIMAELELPEGMGLICRTVGEGRKSVFFKRDLSLLLDYWNQAESAIDNRKAPVLVYSEPTLLERTVRDFMTDEIDGIEVDDAEAFRKIQDMLRRFGGARMARKVVLYGGAEPIFDHFKVHKQLETVYNREVKLPGGGHICIDETEALIAIDVNSGRGRKSTEQPEFILKTNLEAAEEIARQLRLRNVGGLVVLDFIDMRSARDREELFRHMKKQVKLDRAKTKVLPLSKLGLMEMTRQREHESVLDTVYNPCPYCGGSGRVKSALTMSVEIQRKLQTVLKNRKYRDVAVRVIMHPDVLARLKNEDANYLAELEDKYRNVLSFRADPSLHCEEFRLLDPVTGLEL